MEVFLRNSFGLNKFSSEHFFAKQILQRTFCSMSLVEKRNSYRFEVLVLILKNALNNQQFTFFTITLDEYELHTSLAPCSY